MSTLVTPATMVQPNSAQVDAQAAKREVKKTKMFRATIAVCVAYAVIALLILLACLFADGGRQFLVEQAAAFTITLVTGMLLVILFLAVSVYKYEPAPDDLLRTDPYACPDYFELKQTSPADLQKLPEAYRTHMQYVCKPMGGDANNPSGLFDAADTGYWSATPQTGAGKTLAPLQAINNGITDNTLQASCKTVYPQLMQYLDYKDNPDQPTKYRCALLDTTDGCKGMSWTAVCPRTA